MTTLRTALTPLDDPMATDEHLALLWKGVDAWNEWRTENPLICPDLSDLNLRRANLMGAILTWADLSQAILIDPPARQSAADLVRGRHRERLG
jgi:hypothetical protein